MVWWVNSQEVTWVHLQLLSDLYAPLTHTYVDGALMHAEVGANAVAGAVAGNVTYALYTYGFLSLCSSSSLVVQPCVE